MSRYSFHHLQDELAKIINTLPAESRLPSEPALAKQLGVSRATLRETMRSFEVKGMIRRRQGVGTFVAAKVPVLDTGLEVLESLETIARRSGLAVSMGELQVKKIVVDEELAAWLDLQAGMELTQVVRIILTDQRPIAYLVDILPTGILAVEDIQSGFTGSVLDLILNRGEPKLTQSRTEINAIGASREVAHALQIQRDDVLLYFGAQLYSEDGRIVDYSRSYFLPGYFRFHVVRRVG
jgi:GntR family transcriptional regulator